MDLSRHPYFTEWTDPVSGAKNYILTKMAAPLQQSFYFTNSSLSADEKYLWFYAAYPPSPINTRVLGVVGMDPDNPFIKIIPETAFMSYSPLVTPEGDGVYFFQSRAVWLYRLGEKVQRICALDEDYIAGRWLYGAATHLSLSADGKKLLIDGDVGNVWFVATADLETGKVEIINEFPRMYNHAQFSPTDPNIFTMAQDWWLDPTTGHFTHFDQRIWLMDTDRTMCYPIQPKDWVLHGTYACHEWWSKDGRICWTDYDTGAFRFDWKTEQKEHIWKRPLCHTHCDSTGRYWCADQTPYRWQEKPCQILFYDAETQRESVIASGLPLPPVPRGDYHLDPHPHFSPMDTYVVYTTTVTGDVTVALCPADQFKK